MIMGGIRLAWFAPKEVVSCILSKTDAIFQKAK